MCACKHSLPGRWHGRTPVDDDDDDQSCPVAAAEEATLACRGDEWRVTLARTAPRARARSTRRTASRRRYLPLVRRVERTRAPASRRTSNVATPLPLADRREGMGLGSRQPNGQDG